MWNLGVSPVFTLSGLLLLLSTRCLGVFRLWLHGYSWQSHMTNVASEVGEILAWSFVFLHGCFRKWWVFPQIIHFNRVFHYFHHPFRILGYPYSWKHPHDVGELITHVTADPRLIPRLPSKAQKTVGSFGIIRMTLLGDCEGTSDGLHNLTPLMWRPHFLGGNLALRGCA